jgi:hypothetical protein
LLQFRLPAAAVAAAAMRPGWWDREHVMEDLVVEVVQEHWEPAALEIRLT